MSDTAVPELIALEIVDRLGDITIVNDYTFDVSSVDRLSRHARGWTPKHLSIAVEQGSETPVDELSHEGNPPAIAYQVTFDIHAFVRESDKETTPRATAENMMVAAIKQAIVSDGVDWYSFNANAIDGSWGQTSPFQSPEGDHAGVTIPLTVTYRISETNPYQVRV